jgi:hypothetical protein
MESKYASTPVWKLVSGFDETDIPIYFDRQALTSDNLEADSLPFYPRQAASLPGANYQENPLPKNRAYDIPGLAIGFATGTLLERPGDSIGLVDLVNSAFNSRLLLETNQRDKLINRHLLEMADARTSDYEVNASNAGGTDDGFVRKVDFPIFRTLRLPEPIHFDPRESFEMDIRFADKSGIPSASDYDSLGQEPVEVVVAMQVSFD